MIKQFTIGYSRTVNLGNFQSARVEAQVTYELGGIDRFETMDSVREYVQVELRRLMEDTWQAQHRVNKQESKHEQASRDEVRSPYPGG
jgi:hypothetical protein